MTKSRSSGNAVVDQTMGGVVEDEAVAPMRVKGVRGSSSYPRFPPVFGIDPGCFEYLVVSVSNVEM